VASRDARWIERHGATSGGELVTHQFAKSSSRTGDAEYVGAVIGSSTLMSTPASRTRSMVTSSERIASASARLRSERGARKMALNASSVAPQNRLQVAE